MSTDSPCVVLDFSKVHEMDLYVIRMLLCCLEQAMKHNGDVKLASVAPSVQEILRQARVDRLFEIYETGTEAVNSFFRPHFDQAGYAHTASQSAGKISESAA